MDSPKRTQLQALIGNNDSHFGIKINIPMNVDMACDPNLLEPDLSINLEICDLINQKQTSYPREAAMAILGFINGRESHSTMLALAVSSKSLIQWY